MKTEFHGRLNKRDDIEESKGDYDSMNPYGPVSITLQYYSDCFSSLQSLEADDIVSAIIYALSTPPRMEVSEHTGAYYSKEYTTMKQQKINGGRYCAEDLYSPSTACVHMWLYCSYKNCLIRIFSTHQTVGRFCAMSTMLFEIVRSLE